MGLGASQSLGPAFPKPLFSVLSACHSLDTGGFGGPCRTFPWAAALRSEDGFYGALQAFEVKSLEPLPVQQRKPMQNELQMQIVLLQSFKLLPFAACFLKLHRADYLKT